ncbi:MAG: hypothetical protein HUU06_06930 [Planctomycetaceae bacterium]|nr:hypothetical protein [Planctomycetota bacterium]NUN52504.1 hypothetical protein [Planctomycetaceae bacterium]
MKPPVALLAFAALPLLLPVPAAATPTPVPRPEGGAAKPAPAAEVKPGTFPVVAEVGSEDEAKGLLKALDAALETKEEEKVLEALRPFLTKRHKSFVPDLKKLVGDRRDGVAAAAAAALGSQGDKGVASTLLGVVKQEVRDRGFLQRTAVKAAAIESLGRLGVVAASEAILEVGRAMIREPEVRTSYSGPLLRAVVRFLGVAKEKKGVSFLIENFDEPVPADVNSGTNPPAEYWKGRHEGWVLVKDEVRWALKEITGKEMESGRRWRNWFDEEGKKLGMK